MLKSLCGTILTFWENKRWITSTDPYDWLQRYFRYWLDRSLDDGRQIANGKELQVHLKVNYLK